MTRNRDSRPRSRFNEPGGARVVERNRDSPPYYDYRDRSRSPRNSWNRSERERPPASQSNRLNSAQGASNQDHGPPNPDRGRSRPYESQHDGSVRHEGNQGMSAKSRRLESPNLRGESSKKAKSNVQRPAPLRLLPPTNDDSTAVVKQTEKDGDHGHGKHLPSSAPLIMPSISAANSVFGLHRPPVRWLRDSIQLQRFLIGRMKQHIGPFDPPNHPRSFITGKNMFHKNLVDLGKNGIAYVGKHWFVIDELDTNYRHATVWLLQTHGNSGPPPHKLNTSMNVRMDTDTSYTKVNSTLDDDLTLVVDTSRRTRNFNPADRYDTNSLKVVMSLSKPAIINLNDMEAEIVGHFDQASQEILEAVFQDLHLIMRTPLDRHPHLVLPRDNYWLLGREAPEYYRDTVEEEKSRLLLEQKRATTIFNRVMGRAPGGRVPPWGGSNGKGYPTPPDPTLRPATTPEPRPIDVMSDISEEFVMSPAAPYVSPERH